jgi:hypothetical protein
MTATARKRAARIREVAGPLALVRVHPSKYDDTVWVYRITCSACPRTDRVSLMRVSTYRSGQPNDYWAALGRWVRHLRFAHPDADAPCLRMSKPGYIEENR